MSDDITVYQIVNDPIVKSEKTQTKKALYVILVIAKKNMGRVPILLVHECYKEMRLGKHAQNKAIAFLNVAFDPVDGVYIMPHPPRTEMFKHLYLLSHDPDKYSILRLFDSPTTPDESIFQQTNSKLHVRMSELEGHNKAMARSSLAAAQAAQEIKENAEEALERIRAEVLSLFAPLLGQMDNTLERGFQHIIRDVNRATNSVTFSRFDGKKNSFNDVWELIDQIEEISQRYTD